MRNKELSEALEGVKELKSGEAYRAAFAKNTKTYIDRKVQAGYSRLQSPYIPGKLKDESLAIIQSFPSWESFLNDLVKVYKKRLNK